MKFIILGCGSSMGVPRSDGYFGNCDPKNKKNYRTRCSALIKTKTENIIIDTSPDLRNQAILNEQKDFADKQLLEEHKQQENKKQEIENLQGSIDNFQMPQVQGSMFDAPPPSMAPPPTLAPQQMVSPTLLPNEDDREIAMRQRAGIAGLV